MTKQVFPRTISRLAAIQANFQRLLRPNFPMKDIVEEFLHHRFTPEGYAIFQEEPLLVDQDFFVYIATGGEQNHALIEEIISGALPVGWTIGQMEHTTRAIFRCAGFEIQNCPSTPKGVILNEYISAAHCFLLDKGHGLVNAVLDKTFDAFRAQSLCMNQPDDESVQPDNAAENTADNAAGNSPDGTADGTAENTPDNAAENTADNSPDGTAGNSAGNSPDGTAEKSAEQ